MVVRLACTSVKTVSFRFNKMVIVQITSLVRQAFVLQPWSLHKNLSSFSTFPSSFHFSLLLADLELFSCHQIQNN